MVELWSSRGYRTGSFVQPGKRLSHPVACNRSEKGRGIIFKSLYDMISEKYSVQWRRWCETVKILISHDLVLILPDRVDGTLLTLIRGENDWHSEMPIHDFQNIMVLDTKSQMWSMHYLMSIFSQTPHESPTEWEIMRGNPNLPLQLKKKKKRVGFWPLGSGWR